MTGARFSILALLVAGSMAHAGDLLREAPPQAGSVFLLNEAVEIPVRTSGARVDWTAVDYWGGASTGSTVVADGAGIVRPSPGRPGYFDLHLSAKDAAGREIEQADTAFAVVRPPGGAESAFGVMTHFAQGWNTDLMPLLARAGITQIRDEQYWQDVETRRAAYVFSAMYRDYMKAAAAHGLHPLVEMTFGNTLYDHGEDKAYAPHTDDGREGYADYGKAILDQYGAQVSALEVWNEYNGSWCDGPAAGDRPAHYAAMLRTAYARIKAARPDVTVLGGAAVLAPLPWFEDLFAHGALDSLDALVIHPYRGRPEGVETDVAAITAAMRAANRGVAKPIWATECGNSGDLEPGRRASARYLARLMTLLRSENVARMYWYLGRDYHEFSSGLLHDADGRYTPTATYAAYSTLIAELNGAEPVCREPALDARTRVYRFQGGKDEVRVAWTVAPPARLLLEAPGPLHVTNLMGETVRKPPVDGVVTLALDESPCYVRGKVDRVREGARPDRLAAEAEGDFSSTQGGGGWTYGYFEASGAAYDPAAFRPMKWTRSGYAYRWQSPHAAMYIGPDSAHPGANAGRPVWAVRRWQSDTAGVAHFTADLSAIGRGGDGVEAKVFCDGKEVYAAAVGGEAGPASARCDFSAPVAKGMRVDFALTPGRGGDFNFDATTFCPRITLAH